LPVNLVHLDGQSVLAQQIAPIRAPGADADFGDEQPDDIFECDKAGWDVYPGKSEWILIASHVEWDQSAGEVQVRIGDVAEADRVPVESKDFALFAVEQTGFVGHRSHDVGTAWIDGSDEIEREREVEQDGSSSSIRSQACRLTSWCECGFVSTT